ncbi:helix-turn-helix domain-containing protein [Enterococcus faecalis]|uniref:helix-turn-helix domain-containing protein n=1 Tax=Enterococcus faecalis TaxID=1351 RepID=UPI00177E66E0|nr:S24 family peptidase [Enterococcus faecalis]MBD9843859.1 helix-turn-helix domain-containing protein [Enterococcus faecalis]MDR9790165.1 S24 family peptidase [Enterococcus faecalis]
MNEKLFPERLKELRIEKGITLEELAKNIGTTKTTLSRYENGERSPKLQLVGLLANYFQVDMAWLSGQSVYKNTLNILPVYNQLESPRQQKVYDFAESQLKEQKQEIKQKNNSITSLEQFRKKKEEEIIYGTIKWCGCVSAGTGEFLTDETCEEIELPIEQIPTEADFCLSVNGDSMEPTFHNGEYVFVKKQLDIFSGKIGVAIFNGEAFLKRIWFENGEARLESLNKKYKDIIITENDEFRIVGKVVM